MLLVAAHGKLAMLELCAHRVVQMPSKATMRVRERVVEGVGVCSDVRIAFIMTAIALRTMAHRVGGVSVMLTVHLHRAIHVRHYN